MITGVEPQWASTSPVGLSMKCVPGAAGQPQQGGEQTDEMARRVCTVKEVSFLLLTYTAALAAGRIISEDTYTNKRITSVTVPLRYTCAKPLYL